MIIHSIVEQHAEEAAFLWLLRDNASHSPHYSLNDLSKLDNRVEAHLDGLRIAGDKGWEIVAEGLEQGDAGAVFTAGVLAFEGLDEDQMHLVMEAGIESPEMSRGLVSALGWLSSEQATPLIDYLLNAELPVVRRIGVAASAVRRMYSGAALEKMLLEDDSLLRARAAKAVGELGRADLLPRLRDCLTLDDVSCRFFAAWSGTLLGDGDSITTLRTLAVSGNSRAEVAAIAASRRMGLPAAAGWQKELAGKSATTRLAIICAGSMGDPALVPWLIAQMPNPEYSRIAGESFTMITGVDLDYESLEGCKPEEFEAGPTESPDDENVTMDPDEDLPWPQPEMIHKWWGKNKFQYQNGTRFLMGKPIANDHLQQVLRTGRQRQRTAAALELAMLKPGNPLFEVRAPGFRQQQILGLPKR